MSELATRDVKAETMEKALIGGDLASLTPNERLSYYNAVCTSVGLNPLTQPFQYIQLGGKLVLYAKRDATDQLRKIHKVSIRIVSREKVGDVYVVTAQGMDNNGRVDESTGAVTLGKLQGDAIANAMMKAETKAKRRVTLSICGLGMLDESEIETIPNARPEPDRPALPTASANGEPKPETVKAAEETLKAAKTETDLASAWSAIPRAVQNVASVLQTKDSRKVDIRREEIFQLVADMDMPMKELRALAATKGCQDIEKMGATQAQEILEQLRQDKAMLEFA